MVSNDQRFRLQKFIAKPLPINTKVPIVWGEPIDYDPPAWKNHRNSGPRLCRRSALGIVEDVIIHPDTGRVEALWVKPLTLPYAHAVLPVDSIVSWKKHLYVKGEGALAEPDEIIRIAEILNRKERFVGNNVRGESGKEYGKVYDLDFDTRKMTLRYLFVENHFLFLGSKAFFPLRQRHPGAPRCDRRERRGGKACRRGGTGRSAQRGAGCLVITKKVRLLISNAWKSEDGLFDNEFS